MVDHSPRLSTLRGLVDDGQTIASQANLIVQPKHGLYDLDWTGNLRPRLRRY